MGEVKFNPHVYLPKTQEADSIRAGNALRAAEALLSEITPELLSQGKASRILLHRRLNERQVKRWVERLNRLEQEFGSEELESLAEAASERDHALQLAFGPRSFDIKLN